MLRSLNDHLNSKDENFNSVKPHFLHYTKHTIGAIKKDHVLFKLIPCVHDGFIPFASLNTVKRFLCGENVSEVCHASVSNHTLSTIQILSQYGGTESLKRKCFGNNRKTEVWRSGWSSQSIMSITSWGEKMEGNNFDLMAVFKSVALAV